MTRKKPGVGAPFQGRWRIVSMELWAKEDIDLVEPGFIEFDAAKGELCFIAVRAWLDVRYDVRERQPLAEFSWEGVDQGINGAGGAGSLSKSLGGSPAVSSSTRAMNQASSASLGEAGHPVAGHGGHRCSLPGSDDMRRRIGRDRRGRVPAGRCGSLAIVSLVEDRP